MAPLQPLQQTVFEQGPQTGVPPTAEPAFVYQEGQVILPEPINPVQAIDPGIAWNALGAEAMGIAQKMLTETWDYLIETKENGLRDLGDKYQTKLDNAYMRLSAVQNEAQKTGKPADNYVVDNLIQQIQEVQTEWKTESRKILGVGEKPTLLDPKVNVFDENMSDLGLKYQRLGLVAKGTERDIDNQAEKLLFQAQLSRITKAETESNVKYWKSGRNMDVPETTDMVRAGVLPIGTETGILASNLFLDDNKQIKKDSLGEPLIIMREGNAFWNPKADPRETSFTELNLLIAATQRNENSGIINARGIPNKQTQDMIKNWVRTRYLDRDPHDAMEIGLILGYASPSVIPTIAASLNLNESETATLGAITALVRYGNFDTQSLKNPLSWLNPANLETAGRRYTAFTGAGQLQGPTQVVGVQEGESEMLVNNVLLPAYAVALGKQGTEEINRFREQYSVKEDYIRKAGTATLADAVEDSFRLADLLAKNPHLEYVGKMAIAYFYGNQDKFGTVENGQFKLDPKRAKQGIEFFTNVLSTGTGMIPLIDSQGTPSSVYNPYLRELTPVLQKHGTAKVAQSYMGSELSRAKAQDALPIVSRVFKTMDTGLYMAMAEHLSVARQNENGEMIAGSLPMGEHLRLGLASDPNYWMAMGFINDKVELEAMSLDQKLDMVWSVLGTLAPGHEWQWELTADPQDYSFAQSENGGLPLRLVSITNPDGQPIMNTRTGRPISELVVTRNQLSPDYSYVPRNGDGTPTLFMKTHINSVDPTRSVANILSDTIDVLDDEEVPHDFVWGIGRPATYSVGPEFAVQRAIVPDKGTELDLKLQELFRTDTVAYPLVSSADDLRSYMNKTAGGVRALAELDPMLERVVRYFERDFSDMSSGQSKFFSDKVLNGIIAKGQQMGLTTNAEYVGLMLSTVTQKLQNIPPVEDWGLRSDGVTDKGPGWLGVKFNKRGEAVTEYTIGVEIDGKEYEIPTLVPGLTAEEVDAILTSSETGQDLPKEIVDKAVQFAKVQISQDKPVFKEGLTPEQRKKLDRIASRLQDRTNKKNEAARLKRNPPAPPPPGQSFWQQMAVKSDWTWYGLQKQFPYFFDFQDWGREQLNKYARLEREYNRKQAEFYMERLGYVPSKYDYSLRAGVTAGAMLEQAGEAAAIDLQSANEQATREQLDKLSETSKGARAGLAFRHFLYNQLYGPDNVVEKK